MPYRIHKDKGRELAQLRGRFELGQRDFASLAQVSVRTLQRWELGHRVPSESQLTTLLAVLLPIDADEAEHIASTYGTSLEFHGLQPPPSEPIAPPTEVIPPAPPPPPPPPPREAIELSLYMAADDLEMRPARLREPIVGFLRRLGPLGVTCEQAAEILSGRPEPSE